MVVILKRMDMTIIILLGKKNTYILAFFAIFLFGKLTLNAQDSTLIKRKLDIEFSFYMLWSQSNIRNISGEPFAEQYIETNGGNMLRLIYNCNSKHAFACGLNYYRNTISFDYVLEDKYSSRTFYGPMSYTAHVVSLPVSYQYSVLLNEKFTINAEFGYYISFPIIFDVDSSVGYMENREEITVLTTDYYAPQSLVNGFYLSIGLTRRSKRNAVKLSFLCNFPIAKQPIGDFAFFPETPDYTSSGQIKTGFGFYGINLSYILTHKKSL